MKLSELLINQRLVVQLIWGEKKIEFFTDVIGVDGGAVFVRPYNHNGSPLEINVAPGRGVTCNIFTDHPTTRQRISWRNVELTTVDRAAEKVYCVRTYGFNNVAGHDDRRLHERVVISVSAQVFDEQSVGGVGITVHDISDIGISFYAPSTFIPRSQQLVITFADRIDDKEFNVKVDCVVLRTIVNETNIFVGCRIIGENKDYQLYGFMKRLIDKKKLKSGEETLEPKSSVEKADDVENSSDNATDSGSESNTNTQ
ncbi:MAG: PilZ domain-containing protein [Lachnospiraceae bacterium]|nr:PilZ domain-containing protein [Lachnospiraceae bacterium]